MKAKVALLGEGVLFHAAASRLAQSFTVMISDARHLRIPEARLLLLVQDEWNPSLYLEIHRQLKPSGIPWMTAYVSGNEGFLGPLVRMNQPGCPQCADSRRFMAGNATMAPPYLFQPGGAALAGIHLTADHPGIQLMACLIGEETNRIVKDQPAILQERIMIIELEQLNLSNHFVLPDPQCEVCGNQLEDTPEAAIIALQSRFKIHEASGHCRPVADLDEVLHRDYWDPRTGLIYRKTIQTRPAFADVSVHFTMGLLGETVAAGRSHSYAESECTAILEALERYSGLFQRKQIGVRDSYRNLEKQAMNPASVGLYSEEQYCQPDFGFRRFDPHLPIDWVWGYSFLQERPILVPASLAYYNISSGENFVNEASNGCALGGNLEEAILYGILEVVERDSFLMTWYAKLPVPCLDPHSAHDLELNLMIERIRAVYGYDLLFYNITMENEIPGILVIARNRLTSGVRLLCGAGAHWNPVKAAKSAIHEISAILPFVNDYFHKHRKKCLQMFFDSNRVEQMEDHALLYGLPEAESRLDFLWNRAQEERLQTFAEGFKWRPGHKDLTDDLKDILSVFKKLNLEVIVVNQSSSETLRNGLYCVKVLIPGMLPMTFGHRLTRLTGLERVLQVPVKLGYRQVPLTPAELNPYPHPFP